jgi:hypothetical protein
MGVNACIPGSTSQILVFPVYYMLVCSGITILFGKTKVNNVDLVSSSSKTHEEVVRFDISMKKALCMHILHSVDLQHRSRSI